MPRRSIAYALYGLLVAAAIGVACSNPLLFQKLNTLRPAAAIPDLDTRAGRWLDIDAIVRPIPIHGRPVWNVDPATRYRRTMIEGGGNCSQMAFGMAYQLDREAIDYQIIHMLTPGGLGMGDGHTVIRVPYRYEGVDRVGLVDLSFGVILTGASGPLDVAEVEAAPVDGWGFAPLNDRARFPDYHDDFLVDAVLGYVPPSEVHDYYAFLDRVYFSLGSDRTEKYLFDGLALVLGVLPEVFVPLYDELMAQHRVDLFLYRGALAVMRSAAVLLPLLIGFELLRWRRHGARRRRR